MDSESTPTESKFDNELTLEMVSKTGETSDDQPNVAGGRIRLADEAACQAAEMSALLHKRLCIVSYTLCAGFTAFFVWALIMRFNQEVVHIRVLIGLAVVAISLFSSGVFLTRTSAASCRVLHLLEMVVFGFPACFFLVWQHVYLIHQAAYFQLLPDLSGAWNLLIFVYALFVPNPWQRALAVMVSFALMPMGLTLVMVFSHPDCMAAENAHTLPWQLGLQMALTVSSATLGVYSIGQLRSEASAARQLGQYVLQEKIGEGGMGEVYYAEHQLMRRPCAIKIIRPEKAGDPKVLRRFEREVRSSAKLSHWNNIDIYDYGRADDGTFFYVMEYLPGMSLQELVTRHGPVSPCRVIYLLRQVCFALNEAHRNGLIHRDIKPANIIAAQRGGMYDVAKLVDFGLARPLVSPTALQVTQENAITGSPLYMSPEQTVGEGTLDPRSDIYSLGCVAYFLLTGRPPFNETQPIKVMVAHASQQAARVSQHADGVPHDVEELVMKCLEKQAVDRYQTVMELLDGLEACACASDWTRDDSQAWWKRHVDRSDSTPPSPAVTSAHSS